MRQGRQGRQGDKEENLIMPFKMITHPEDWLLN